EKFQRKLDGEQTVLTARLDQTLADWDQGGDDEEAAAFRDLRSEWERYKIMKDVTVKKALARSREEAFINATGAEREQFEQVTNQLTRWMQTRVASDNRVYQRAESQHDRVFNVSLAVIVMLTLLVGGAGFFITRSIVRPIEVLKDAAARIANRDPVRAI